MSSLWVGGWGGTGTVWIIGGQVTATNAPTCVGLFGPGQMTCSNGLVNFATLTVGTGSGYAGTLTVSGGTLTVSGGTLTAWDITAGYAGFGTGTIWFCDGADVTATNNASVVGDSGIGTLTVSNSTVRLASLLLGQFQVVNSYGTLSVVGGNLFVTNATHDAVLEVRNGVFTLAAGTVILDRLVMTNACGQFIHTGGTLSVGSLLLDPGLDADADGIPNAFDLDPFNPSDAGSDPDGDGQGNLAEFLAGTDPTNSASFFGITAIAREGDDVRVTWMTAAGKTNALDVGAATNTPASFCRVRLVP